MADHHEKELQSSYPATANAHARSGDAEAADDHNAGELKRQKRNKLITYITIFVIFQIGVITVFSLTVMKVKTPKFRVREAAFTNFNAGAPAMPSLQATMVPQFSVKNTNFGRYKFQTTTVDFFYNGAQIGAATVANNKAGWISTKRISAEAVDLNIAATPELMADLSAGVVTITCRAQMRGKVELMFILKKNKATNLNCFMEIVTATQTVRNIVCK